MSRLAIGIVLVVTSAFAQDCLRPAGCDIHVHVRRVSIQSALKLSPREHGRTVAQLRQLGGDRSNEEWRDNLTDIAQEIVRAAYQNHGYFKADARAKVAVLRSSEACASVDILVTVKPGEQYRLREIRWTGMSRFTAEQLSALVTARPGEILNRDKVADGIQAVKELYDSVGFINFTDFPRVEVDEAKKEVSITMDMDEGGQFTLGPVIVSGFTRQELDQLDEALQSLRGQPFTPVIREQIRSRVSSLAPCAGPPEMERHLDERERRVSYFFDYSGCYDSWLESLDAVPDSPGK